MRTLQVFLHGEHAGALNQSDDGSLSFSYTDTWVERDGMALSIALPVRPGVFDDRATRPFFSGLLPEGDFLDAIAREFGVSGENPFSMLEAIGGECAGAVSLSVGSGGGLPGEEPLWLSASQLRELIVELPAQPLPRIKDGEGLRLSLAGAQRKLPVAFGGGKIGITQGNPPSTHIIKFPRSEIPGMVANESFCLELARLCGLAPAKAVPRIAGNAFVDDSSDPEYLLVTRYDRELTDEGLIRIHQEDFCQALGFLPEFKYEKEGGPGVAECSALIRSASAAPALDILRFGDALVFNFLIGNNDAHSKNYSLLREGPLTPKMAPLYDLISTAVYPSLDRHLAMKYGGETRPDYVRRRHLKRLAADLGIQPEAFLRRAFDLAARLETVLGYAASNLGSDFGSQPIIGKVQDEVGKGISRMRFIQNEE